MAFLETKHTLSRISRIKKDLNNVITIISYISMAIFLAYYIYLLILNLHEYFYIIIYSSLIAVIVSLFIIELIIRDNKKILKNEKRLVAEKKRRWKTLIKVIKFLAKFTLVFVALYETFTNFNLSISNMINICSLITLILQVLIEIVIYYIVLQIDYFRLSTELDLDASGTVIKKLMKVINPIKNLEEEAIKSTNGALYSEQELKMIEEIKKDAEKFIKEKQAKENQIKQMLPAKRKTRRKSKSGNNVD